jgi:mRNA interferase RelE/StbE
MKTLFRESFWRDVKKIKDKKVIARLEEVIKDAEAAVSHSEISKIAKMSVGTNAYRIRVGGFRAGVYVEDDTIEFVRFLDRKDIYRYFP